MKSLLVIASFCALTIACDNKDETQKGKLSASLMKSATVSDASLRLSTSNGLLDGTGSSVQSFTPTSLKIPIFAITACPKDSSSCTSLYRCEANTYEDCAVEISDINEFVDAINSSEVEVEDGATFDSIAVQYCKDGENDQIQRITLNGTVEILGTTYATDPDSGLVAGTTGKDASINIKGGCASMYNLDKTITVSKDEPKKISLFFDASLIAYGGVSGGSEHVIDYSYPDGGKSCVGTQETSFVCTQVITIVSTVDEGTPTTEHYLIADTTEATGSTSTSAPTGSMVLYFSSNGDPIGGVQNNYRLAGADLSFGQAIGGGLGLYPTIVDTNTLEIGKPGGSISLANWFENFKRESHSGVYTYSGAGGVSMDGTYTATKL